MTMLHFIGGWPANYCYIRLATCIPLACQVLGFALGKHKLKHCGVTYASLSICHEEKNTKTEKMNTRQALTTASAMQECQKGQGLHT